MRPVARKIKGVNRQTDIMITIPLVCREVKTGNLVCRLMTPYEGRWHLVVTDNFYTSILLCEHLLAKKIYTIGTINKNMCGFPAVLTFRKGQKELERGESRMVFNGSTAVCLWKDKKLVYFAGTTDITSRSVSMQRWIGGRKQAVSCPLMVRTYNEHMGGTDLNDQYTRMRKQRRHYKYPSRVIVKCFQWAAFNAYIIALESQPHHLAGSSSTPITSGWMSSFSSFLVKLRSELVPEEAFPVSTTQHRYQRVLKKTATTTTGTPARLDGLKHMVWADPQEKGKTCRVCQEKISRALKQGKTTLPPSGKPRTKCLKCNVFLCCGTNKRNCWYDYHTKLSYWL